MKTCMEVWLKGCQWAMFRPKSFTCPQNMLHVIVLVKHQFSDGQYILLFILVKNPFCDRAIQLN